MTTAVGHGMGVAQPIAKETVVREWDFAGDTRKVSLLRTAEERLICQVFNTATRECTRRYLKGRGLDYQSDLLRSMHPELVRTSKGPACAAVFISNTGTTVEKWHTEDSEIRLLRMAQGQTGLWVAIDTSTNKFNAWAEADASEQRVAALVKDYFPTLTLDGQGFPKSFTFRERIQTAILKNRKIYFLRNGNDVECLIFEEDPSRRLGTYQINGLGELVTPGIVEFLERHGVGYNSNGLILNALTEIVGKRHFEKTKELHIYRIGENFGVRIFDPQAKTSHFFFPTTGLESIPTLEGRATYLKSADFIPERSANGRLLEFNVAKIKSLLDKKTIIDANNWALTLVSCGQSRLGDPLGWGGHAMLVIEGFHESEGQAVADGYFLKIAHLMVDSENMGNIEIPNSDVLGNVLGIPYIPCKIDFFQADLIINKETDEVKYQRPAIVLENGTSHAVMKIYSLYKYKTETWSLPAQRLGRLIRRITNEVDMQENGLLSRYFYAVGSQSFMAEPVKVREWNSVADWRQHLQAIHNADPEIGQMLKQPIIHAKGKMGRFIVFLTEEDVRRWEEPELASYTIVSTRSQTTKIEEYVPPDNCIDWAIKNAAIVDIHLRPGLLRNLFHVPKEYTLKSWVYGLVGWSTNEEDQILSDQEIAALPRVLPDSVRSQLIRQNIGVIPNPQWRSVKHSILGIPVWMSTIQESDVDQSH